jgi:hypothetical protein
MAEAIVSRIGTGRAERVGVWFSAQRAEALLSGSIRIARLIAFPAF